MGAGWAVQRALQAAREQLGPGVAAGAAADQGQRGAAGAGLAHGLQAVTQAEGHAFHHCVSQIGRCVLGAQADEAAAGARVVVGCALATEVGQEDRRAGLTWIRQGGDLGRQPGFAVTARQLCDPAEGAGGAEHHGHLVPARWQRVGEGVHCLLGRRLEAAADAEHHARGAERDKTLVGLGGTYANGAGGVVTGAAGDRQTGRESPVAGDVGVQRGADLAPFDQPGHLRFIEPAGRQHDRAPAPGRHVQPQRAGGVGHLADGFAAEPQAQPVLGQQHTPDLGKAVWFMLAQPDQLGRGEAGHGQVARDLARLRHALFQRLAGLFGATVVPQDGGAQHLVVGTKQHRAVHLAGQADGAHLGPCAGCKLSQLRHRQVQRLPPVGRILLAPAGLRAAQCQGGFGAGVDPVVVAQQQQFQARGAEVNAEVHGACPCRCARQNGWPPGAGIRSVSGP